MSVIHSDGRIGEPGLFDDLHAAGARHVEIRDDQVEALASLDASGRVLSARSLRNVKVVRIGDADTLSLLRHTSLVLTQGAFDEVQKREQAVVAKKGASA